MMRLWIIAVLALGACAHPKALAPVPQKGNPAQKDLEAQDYLAAPLPRAQVILEGAKGPERVEVEVAGVGPAEQRGLMWRTELPEGTGMLFVFPRPAPIKFWMKNTLISLDMVFITEDLHVLGVVEQAEPGSLESRGFPEPSRYVLEVPGGWTNKIGLVPGSKVELRDMPN